MSYFSGNTVDNMSFIWRKLDRKYRSFTYHPVDLNETIYEPCLDQRPLRPRRALTAADKKINILALLLVPTIFYWFYFRNNNEVRRQPYLEQFPDGNDRVVTEFTDNSLILNEILSQKSIPVQPSGIKTKPNEAGIDAVAEFFENRLSPKLRKANTVCVLTHIKPAPMEAHRIKINRNITFDDFRINIGGYYKPSECRPKYNVSILVPYRRKKQALNLFINNIHPFLMKQKVAYRIFVVEQYGNDLFNRGKLLNAGFLEMTKVGQWDCVIFHDVDLLPIDDRISYWCPTIPRHMSTTVVGADKKRSPYSLFGGVTAMSVRDFKNINGFSNLYWGLGGEDNDMFWRLRSTGKKISKLNKSVGQYECTADTPHSLNPNRFQLLSTATERIDDDGLSTVRYGVVSYNLRQFYSHILLDINPKNESFVNIPLL